MTKKPILGYSYVPVPKYRARQDVSCLRYGRGKSFGLVGFWDFIGWYRVDNGLEDVVMAALTLAVLTYLALMIVWGAARKVKSAYSQKSVKFEHVHFPASSEDASLPAHQMPPSSHENQETPTGPQTREL